MFIVGIDVGGTFTDLVALDEATGAVVTTKALSTPRDLLDGVLACVDQAGVRLADCRFVIHGTTIGINALLELKGARTGLVTRIGRTPAPHETLYGIERDGLHIDAIALVYDHDRFVQRFLARWPAGSAAHASYLGRIVWGPGYSLAQARPPATA